jgi:hypothetical protein
MSADTVTLTRAELAIKCLEFQGWTELKMHPQPDLIICTNPDEKVPRHKNVRRPDRLGGRCPSEHSLQHPVDPTHDIAAAWALWEWYWAKEGGTEQELWRRMETVRSWREAKVHTFTASQMATWLCLKVYWAVTGSRVVLTEEGT